MSDYYKILGVHDNADQDTIKRAYRELAKKFHPDRNKEEGAEERFKEINKAYETLSDEDKRSKYDRSRLFNSSGASFDDMFKGFNFNQDPFSRYNQRQDPFSAHYNSHQNVPKGTSLNITLQVNLTDVLNGVEKKIKIKRNKKCKSCSGTGADGGTSFQTCGGCYGQGYININKSNGFVQINSVQSCNVCSGTGKVILENCLDCFGSGLKAEEDIVDIKIPAGASDGMQFVIDGKGNEAKGPGKNGELYIKIKEIQHPNFVRKGIDLISVSEVTFIDAVLGTNIEVEMPDGGKVKAVVDPGTISGTTLRFSGKGIPNMGYGGKGDFLVEVHIKVPQDVTDEEKEFLESLKEINLFK